MHSISLTEAKKVTKFKKKKKSSIQTWNKPASYLMYFYEWVTQTKHQYMDLSFQSSVVLLSLWVQVNKLLV